MKKTLLAIAAGALMATAAQADTVTTSASFGLATTNWSELLTLSQFDGSLGTLNSVTISYGGEIQSMFNLESLDAQPATLTANAGGTLTFGGPISDVLNLSASSSPATVSAFDGTIDFGGTSGTMIGPVVAADASSVVLTTGLGAFIGAGTFDISVDALAASSASGAGNLITQINTEAMANIEITYDYSVTPPPAAPEPATLGLVGLALAGVAASRRRKA